MAKKFVDADEAARMLGISVSELNEMRDRHEVFPVRDGGQWKYRLDEMERLVADRADGGGPQAEYADSDNLDSILLSEVELGHSGPGPSSTVIGSKGSAPSPDSDIKLAGPKSVAPPSLSRMPDSPSELPDLGSDVQLATPAEMAKAGSSLSKKFDELDTLDLELPPALSSSGSGSDKLSAAPSDSGFLALDDNLALGEEPQSKLGGSSSKRRAAGSAIDLSGSDDDDLVLGSGSSGGSDLTHSAGGDSGISLIDPSDSGLALDDDALEMKTNSPSGKTSLNLGGGDDDLILLEEEADPNTATQLKADDDFLLTPTDDGAGQDSDSGSQVIALDADSDFDEGSATMVGGRLGGAGMLETGATEDFGGGFAAAAAGAPALGLAPGGMPLTAPQPTAMLEPPEVKEAPFGAFAVIFLALCALFLAAAGMMMFDLMRNMWSWDGAYHVNSSLMEGILEMVGTK